MTRIFFETDGVALVRQRPGRTHILTDAHTGFSELSSYLRVFQGIRGDQLRAFKEEVNTCGEIRCLLPQVPISALPKAALRGARQNPDSLRFHIADFISGIPALDALSPFEHLVVALACFDAEDWVTPTLEEVLREHAVQLEGRTVHLCVRHQPIHSKAHRPYGALEGDNHLTAVPLPSCSPNAFGGARRLLAEASEQGAEIYWYPGGGQDLTPLLLLPDRSCFQRSGFQPGVAATSPLLLWITDLMPVEMLVSERGDHSYEKLWRRLGAQCRIVHNQEFDLGESAPRGRHHVLDAEIVRANSGTQRFRLLYSEAHAGAFPTYFAAQNLRIAWMAFIRASGSFGGGPPPAALMPMLSRHLTADAMPEALIADQHFAGRGGWPGYVRLGSREPDWTEGPVWEGKRLCTGGVSGWGVNYRGPGNVALWAREDRYSDFMRRVRKCSARSKITGVLGPLGPIQQKD